MSYIGFLICIVVAYFVIKGILLVMVAMTSIEREKEQMQQFRTLGNIMSSIALVLLIGGVTLGSVIRTVPAGHTGLVYTFNDITGRRDPGINAIWPWQGFKVVNTQTQKIRPETTCNDGKIEQCLEAFSSETQDVFIIPSINLRLQRGDALEALYANVGPDWIDKIVRPRLHQVFKDITAGYNSTGIAPAREEIRAKALQRLQEEMDTADIPEAAAIVIEDLLVDNIEFRQAFVDAIEAKQVAEQEAQRQLELVTAAQHEADQAVKRAEGEAEANTILAESLRENGNFILQFRAIEKLSEKVRIIMLPNDSGIIPVLSSDLLAGADEPVPAPGR